MSSNNQSIIQLGGQDTRQFVKPDIPVHKSFGYHTVTIPVGYQGRLFRNGAYERNLAPGRHNWWSPFSDYSVSIVDARVRLLNLVTRGSIPGPEDENRQPTPSCRITVPLNISVVLANIETILSIDTPFGILEAMISNYMATNIGQLRYDQTSKWVSSLQGNLEVYLQNNSVTRTGLQVQEVFVGEPDGTSEADKRQLQIFRLATAVKMQHMQAAEANQQRVDSAQATKTEADLLGVAPFVRELSRTPEGVKIIEADLELRKMAIAAGVWGPQVSIAEQITPQSQSTGPSFLSSPGQPNATQTDPFPSQPISGVWHQDTTFPGSTSPSSGSPTSNPSGVADIDKARLDEDRKYLQLQGSQQQGSQLTINESPGVLIDATGKAVNGYTFMLTRSDGLVINFDLLPGYPRLAPQVKIRRPGTAAFVPYQGTSVQTWSSATSWLSTIASEILAAH